MSDHPALELLDFDRQRRRVIEGRPGQDLAGMDSPTAYTTGVMETSGEFLLTASLADRCRLPILAVRLWLDSVDHISHDHAGYRETERVTHDQNQRPHGLLLAFINLTPDALESLSGTVRFYGSLVSHFHRPTVASHLIAGTPAQERTPSPTHQWQQLNCRRIGLQYNTMECPSRALPT